MLYKQSLIWFESLSHWRARDPAIRRVERGRRERALLPWRHGSAPAAERVRRRRGGSHRWRSWKRREKRGRQAGDTRRRQRCSPSDAPLRYVASLWASAAAERLKRKRDRPLLLPQTEGSTQPQWVLEVGWRECVITQGGRVRSLACLVTGASVLWTFDGRFEAQQFWVSCAETLRGGSSVRERVCARAQPQALRANSVLSLYLQMRLSAGGRRSVTVSTPLLSFHSTNFLALLGLPVLAATLIYRKIFLLAFSKVSQLSPKVTQPQEPLSLPLS